MKFQANPQGNESREGFHGHAKSCEHGPKNNDKWHFYESWFVQNIRCHMLALPIPDIQIQTNNHQNQNLETSMNKQTFVGPRYLKSCQHVIL